MAWSAPFSDLPVEPTSVPIGSILRASAVFTLFGTETELDPDDVFVEFTDPSNNVTTYEYGVDVELVNDGVGEYHVDIDCDEVGDWTVRFYSTGNGQAAQSGTFTVV